VIFDEDPVGFAIWHLHSKPSFPRDFGDLMGFKVGFF